MRATINNTFHMVSKNINLKPGKNIISGRTVREWKRALCVSGCTCSGADGLRGGQGVPCIEGPDGEPLEYEDDYDTRTGEQRLIVWA